MIMKWMVFFFSSRRRHTRFDCDWSSDVCSSDLSATEASDRGFTAELLASVAEAGFEAVVFTVDLPAAGRRERDLRAAFALRSEERRVGKEGRSRWSPDH